MDGFGQEMLVTKHNYVTFLCQIYVLFVHAPKYVLIDHHCKT